MYRSWKPFPYSLLSLVEYRTHPLAMDPIQQFMQATGTTDPNQATAMLEGADGDLEVRICAPQIAKDCSLVKRDL